jgi:hypothetical protein
MVASTNKYRTAAWGGGLFTIPNIHYFKNSLVRKLVSPNIHSNVLTYLFMAKILFA